MAKRDPIQEIIRYNARFVGRYPILLRQKVTRLTSGPFGFFRGTFNLFARDLVNGVLDPWENSNPFTSVESQLIGDIHSENYGTFKASDGSIRYDVNDFDETTRGSFDFDCKRAATSLFLLASDAQLSLSDATAFVEMFVRTYVQAIEQFVAQGGAESFGYSDKHLPELAAVRELILKSAETRRHDFIAGLTEMQGNRRVFRSVGKKHFDLSAADRALAEKLLADYIVRLGPVVRAEPDFYRLEDVTGRIAGAGSLGRLRMVLLLNGNGSATGRNILLEFKEALPSAYDEARGRVDESSSTQPRAATVIDAERRMQTESNRYLGFAVDGAISYQVRELGPRDQRLDIAALSNRKGFAQLAQLYATLLAKCHVKSDVPTAGQVPGAHTATVLKDRAAIFIKRVTAFALAYSELVEDDHRQFCARTAEVEQAWQL